MTKKYCYREVDFYQEGYMGMIFFKGEDNENKILYPMTRVYKSLKPLKKEIKELKMVLENRNNDPLDVYGALVVKLKFRKTFPLKMEYWQDEPEIKLDKFYRVNQYLKMLKEGESFYQIMVMPYHFEVKKKKWFFSNWLPVLISATEEQLAQVSIMSNETAVDSSAKNIGLYTIEWIKGLYLDNWELVENGGISSSTKTEFDC